MMRQRHDFARSGDAAEVLIIGDSTALMGVDAVRLTGKLPGRPRVYNLGLFLGLPLTAYGEAAAGFITNHPGQVKSVVLLITPWRLTDASAVEVHAEFWRQLKERGDQSASSEPGMWNRVLAMRDLKERLLSRALPFLSHGKIGVHYGRLLNAERRMDDFNGSLVTAGNYNRTRQEAAIWSLDPTAPDQGAVIRRLIPRDVELVFGVMPIPETLVTPGAAAAAREELVHAFNETLHADRVLDGLPTALPDGFFADAVHLNARGQRWFTDLLARDLTESPDTGTVD
jgi:hypothetical protein